jgi:hypothetical protein
MSEETKALFQGKNLKTVLVGGAVLLALLLGAFFFAGPAAAAEEGYMEPAAGTELVADPIPKAPDWWAGNPDIVCKELPVVDGKWLCYNAPTPEVADTSVLDEVIESTDTE